ncbi:MAG: hypothetical protein WC788_07630 [Candidatus Paceibacterota bacterium]
MKPPNEKLVDEFNELWPEIKKAFPETVQEKIKERTAAKLLKSAAKARDSRSGSAIGYILYYAAEWICNKNEITPKTMTEIKRIVITSKRQT